MIALRNSIACLCAVLVLGMGSASLAQSSLSAPSFFSILGDVPAMVGLYEVPENHLFFDKPAGRIAELAIVLDGVTPAQVRDYYAQTLPQFGWNAQGADHFSRDGEQLRLLFEGQDFLKISVSPIAK